MQDSSQMTLIYAKDVQIGDRVAEFDSRTGIDSLKKISKIEIVRQRGIFAPLTVSGNIFVSRIAVSCHSTVRPQHIAALHSYFLFVCKILNLFRRCVFSFGVLFGKITLIPGTDFLHSVYETILPH